jgi:hypothetical protein
MMSGAGHTANIGDSFEVRSEKMMGEEHVGYEGVCERPIFGMSLAEGVRRLYGTGSLMSAQCRDWLAHECAVSGSVEHNSEPLGSAKSGSYLSVDQSSDCCLLTVCAE